VTAATLVRKARAIAHVRRHFPGAILVITPPGAAILASPIDARGIFWHEVPRHGPPHKAWERMARSMKKGGLV